MIIYVLSDTHGNIDYFLEKVNEIGKPDKLFFLGDYVEDGEKIRDTLNIETIIVKGNNDYKNKIYNYDEIISINNHKIFLTHGHRYDVNFDINNLYYRSLELNVELSFFGHTHKRTKIVENGITMLNPGSPSFPRGGNLEKSFIKLEINDDIKYDFIII